MCVCVCVCVHVCMCVCVCAREKARVSDVLQQAPKIGNGSLDHKTPLYISSRAVAVKGTVARVFWGRQSRYFGLDDSSGCGF